MDFKTGILRLRPFLRIHTVPLKPGIENIHISYQLSQN